MLIELSNVCIESVYVRLPSLEYFQVKWQSGNCILCMQGNLVSEMIDMEEA